MKQLVGGVVPRVSAFFLGDRWMWRVTVRASGVCALGRCWCPASIPTRVRMPFHFLPGLNSREFTPRLLQQACIVDRVNVLADDTAHSVEEGA
eukprot:1258245-Amorphochlora_amoeboformis.AAC.1